MGTRDLTHLFSLSGRNTLIAGGASGLGLAVAEGFAQFGAAASVVDIDEGAAALIAGEINAGGGRAMAVRWDVSGPDDVDAALARSREPGLARPKALVRISDD